MPSTATITSFYVFTAGTPARAAEVNSDFLDFRGHLLPIDGSLTAAAVTRSYDLGSTEHRWGTLDALAADLSITTTVAMVMQGLSAGAIAFKKDGTTLFSIVDTGFIGANATPMAPTLTASACGIAAPADAFNTTLTASGAIAGSTVTITTVGRRVAIALVGSTTAAAHFLEFGYQTSTAAAPTAGYSISVVRDSSTLPSLIAGGGGATFQRGGGGFFMIDTPAAGLHTYYLTVVSLTTNTFIYPSHCRFVVWEF